jgi:hypothetical protein
MTTALIRRGVALTVLVPILAACNSKTTTTPQDPTTPGTTRCRTYPTSAVEQTVAPGFSATRSSSGSYNAAARQTTYTVNYADSQNVRFTYTLTTTYRSTQEFVDEVEVIPPLTLSTGSSASGGTTFVVTNNYDSQRRLTGSTHASAGSTVITTYTSWDAAGRPTAGASSANGPIAIAYNDSTRTAVTTLTIGTQTATFDTNGNPTFVVQNYANGTTTMTTTVQATAQVCY